MPDIRMDPYRKRYVNVMIPMRDGVRLGCDIYMPGGDGPFPAILIRTPYQKSPAVSPRYEEWGYYFADHSFAYIVQDVRGKGDSEGEFYPFLQEATDGYDSVEWIAAQDWCDGNVGTEGNSYLAFVQYLTLKANPPHLRAMAVSGSPGDLMRHGMAYLNGIKCLYMASWCMYTNGRASAQPADRYLGPDPYDHLSPQQRVSALPLSSILPQKGFSSQYWDETLTHELNDDFYSPARFFDSTSDEHNVACLHVTGYFDIHVLALIDYYEQMLRSSAKEDQYLICGPWPHECLVNPEATTGPFTFDNGVMDIKAQKVDFFTRYLKGDASVQIPKVRQYDMNTRRWHTSERMENSREYLLYPAGGRLLTEGGSGTATHYEYNPMDPSLAFQWACPYDATAYAASRDDILTYVYEAQETITLDGRAVAELCVATDGIDTDFLCYVTCEVEGRQLPLAFGGQRLMMREALDRKVAAIPGEEMLLRIRMDYLYLTLHRGQKLMLHVTSSAFPMYARNLNTGEAVAGAVEFRTAKNSIIENKSRLILKVARG